MFQNIFRRSGSKKAVELSAAPVKLHYRHSVCRQHQDETDHVAVVVLHDYFRTSGSSGVFASALSRLPGLGVVPVAPLEVYMPDLRGHGRSPAGDAFDGAAHVADVINFVNHVIESSMAVHLVGFGWGGVIAAGAALAHPGRFSSLCLINAVPAGQNPGLRQAARTRLELAQRHKSFQSFPHLEKALGAELPSADARRQLMECAGVVNKADGTLGWFSDLERLASNVDTAFTLPSQLLGGEATFDGPSVLVSDTDVSNAEKAAATKLTPSLQLKRVQASLDVITIANATAISCETLQPLGILTAVQESQ